MRTLSTKCPDRRRNAFTLIEIMVATVIMIVLVGLVIQITSEVLKVWNRSSGKLAANAEARIALELLTQDLETAVFRNNGMRWLEAEQENLGDPFSGNNSFKTTKLKLFSPALDRPREDEVGNPIPGDISAISYLLRYSDPIDGAGTGDDRTFILYRNVIDPKTTFDDLMGAGNQEAFTKDLWSDEQTIDDGKNYLATNIVDFRVDFYYADEDGSKVLGDTFYGGTSATVGPDATNPDAKFPLLYADIILKIISDEALKLVQSDAIEQAGFNSQEEYIAANSEVYTRRVNFLARPL
jgi:type II secretory pathway pseudopilin PulG